MGWLSEALLQTLVVSGRDCPVEGGLARSQWLQRTWDKYCDLERTSAAVAGKKTVEQKRVTDVAWVNHKLTAEEKEMFSAWDAPEEDIKALFVELLNGGYRLTYAYDKFNKALMCSVVCQLEGHPNFGKGFSTFAHEWDKLNALVAFKHVTLWGGVWPEGAANRPTEDFG